MTQYKVMVDDNFHYMEEDERWELGTFSTLEEAIAACRKHVDRSLMASHKRGMSAAQLFEHYTSFGDEPFILTPPGAPMQVLFSARDYARKRAAVLCGERAPRDGEPP